MATDVLSRRWTLQDAIDKYGVLNWGGGYFNVNEAGHILAQPLGPSGDKIDVKELVDEMRERGIGLPLLIRFSDILKSRIAELNDAFKKAIADCGYKGSYRGVYPIKVNQEKHVVESIAQFGRPYNYGLEAGSKPELLAILAVCDDDEALILCNGYKDEEFIEYALRASKLGRTVIITVEKMSEIDLIHSVAARLGVRPRIGLRAKLASRGSGRWEASAGDRSKFGLTSREMLEAVQYMREKGTLDCCELLHFHLGSQISAIQSLKNALREAGRYFAELVKLGLPLRYLDVGGGLGVDYDGSQTNFPSSMNYTLQEYANDVVFQTMELCDQENVPHPTIVTEAGRAIVAHHSMLVIDILGVSEFSPGKFPEMPPEGSPPIVRNLYDTLRDVSRKNILEAYHDAIQYRDEALTLFAIGQLSLEERVIAESVFWAICQRILKIVRDLPEVPDELEGLEKALSDTYFCNFSMFQSVPDSWAIEQLFPVVPIHRLNEEPSRRAVLADMTCDSDGKIDRFIDRRDVKDVLELHPWRNEPYLLGIFLVGAYQEILGDLHNLFGDTNTVHVSLAAGGGYHVDHVLLGDTVTDVLNYVSYNRDELVARMRQATEAALRAKRITIEESRHLMRMYEEGLTGYTYLES